MEEREDVAVVNRGSEGGGEGVRLCIFVKSWTFLSFNSLSESGIVVIRVSLFSP